MHESTFEYLQPTEGQIERLGKLREAARVYCEALEDLVPEGTDKYDIIRRHRQNAMWANVSVTRHADGTPRE